MIAGLVFQSVNRLTRKQTIEEIETLLGEMDQEDLTFLRTVVSERYHLWREDVERWREEGRNDEGRPLTDEDFRWMGWTTLALDRGRLLMAMLTHLAVVGPREVAGNAAKEGQV